MAKILLKSALISLGINVLGLIINLVSFFIFGVVPLAIPFSGGEWSGYAGFGIMMNRTYPMSTPDNIIKSRDWISIAPVSFIIPFVIIFVITLVILIIKQKSK